MSTFNDSGIVLNSYNLGETDKIINIYTRENGLVRAIAKGVRKSTSKFSGKLDQLNCCFFQFAKGKNLDTIIDCEQINTFSNLRTDLKRLTTGFLFLEIVNGFAHEQESECNEVYELLYNSLDQLQTIKNPFLFSINFVSNFLSIHGYKPQLDSCVSCSTCVSMSQCTNDPYSTALGGILCTECAKLIEHIKVDESVIKIIREGRGDPCGRPNEYKEEDIRKALDLLRKHLDIRAKNKIKSFDLVFSL